MRRDDLPPPVQTDTGNAFAHRSMGVRAPSIIDDTIARNAYADPVADALKRLRDEVAGKAPLRLFEAPAPHRAGIATAHVRIRVRTPYGGHARACSRSRA